MEKPKNQLRDDEFTRKIYKLTGKEHLSNMLEKIEKGLYYRPLNGNSCFYDTADGKNIMICLPGEKSISTIHEAKQIMKKVANGKDS